MLTRKQEQKMELNKSFVLAVERSNEVLVRKYVKEGANIHWHDQDGNTVLHKASDAKIISLLLSAGADINAMNFSGKTPLLHAITNKDNDGRRAFCGKSRKIIYELLKHRPNVNAKDHYGKTPLYAYIKVSVCELHVVGYMLKLGANVNVRTSIGSTLLHAAVGNVYCYVEIVNMLLKRGANPNFSNRSGETPLHYALDRKYCKLSIIKALLKYRADVCARDCHGYTPLHFAVNNPSCTFEVIKEIVLHDPTGVVVNKQNNETGCTPLHVALSFGCLKDKMPIIEFLLEKGVQVNAKDRRSFSHLHVAVDNPLCHENVISVLVKYGADVNARNEKNQTPLHFAFKKTIRFDVIKELLRYGADITALDLECLSPLIYAMHNSNFKIRHLIELFRLSKNIDNCLCKYKRVRDILSLCVSLGKLDFTRVVLKYMMLKSYLNVRNHRFTKTMSDFFQYELSESNIHRNLIIFIRECMDEINDMLCDKITDNITFYEVMVKDFSKLSKNHKVRHCLIEAIIYRMNISRYPLYKNLLLNVRKVHFIEGLSNFEIYVKRENSNDKIILDQYSVHRITDFLSREDVISCIAAYSMNYKSYAKKWQKANDVVCSTSEENEESTLDFTKEIELKIQQLSNVEIDFCSGFVRISDNKERRVRGSTKPKQPPAPESRVFLRRSKRVFEQSSSSKELSSEVSTTQEIQDSSALKLKRSLPMPETSTLLRRSKRICR